MSRIDQDPILKQSPLHPELLHWPNRESCRVVSENGFSRKIKTIRRIARLDNETLVGLKMTNWLRKREYQDIGIHYHSNEECIRVRDWMQYAYIDRLNYQPVLSIAVKESETMKLSCPHLCSEKQRRETDCVWFIRNACNAGYFRHGQTIKLPVSLNFTSSGTYFESLLNSWTSVKQRMWSMLEPNAFGTHQNHYCDAPLDEFQHGAAPDPSVKIYNNDMYFTRVSVLHSGIYSCHCPDSSITVADIYSSGLRINSWNVTKNLSSLRLHQLLSRSNQSDPHFQFLLHPSLTVHLSVHSRRQSKGRVLQEKLGKLKIRDSEAGSMTKVRLSTDPQLTDSRQRFTFFPETTVNGCFNVTTDWTPFSSECIPCPRGIRHRTGRCILTPNGKNCSEAIDSSLMALIQRTGRIYCKSQLVHRFIFSRLSRRTDDNYHHIEQDYVHEHHCKCKPDSSLPQTTMLANVKYDQNNVRNVIGRPKEGRLYLSSKIVLPSTRFADRKMREFTKLTFMAFIQGQFVRIDPFYHVHQTCRWRAKRRKETTNLNGTVLHFQNIEKNDAGVYTCFLRNGTPAMAIRVEVQQVVKAEDLEGLRDFIFYLVSYWCCNVILFVGLLQHLHLYGI